MPTLRSRRAFVPRRKRWLFAVLAAGVFSGSPLAAGPRSDLTLHLARDSAFLPGTVLGIPIDLALGESGDVAVAVVLQIGPDFLSSLVYQRSVALTSGQVVGDGYNMQTFVHVAIDRVYGVMFYGNYVKDDGAGEGPDSGNGIFNLDGEMIWQDGAELEGGRRALSLWTMDTDGLGNVVLGAQVQVPGVGAGPGIVLIERGQAPRLVVPPESDFGVGGAERLVNVSLDQDGVIYGVAEGPVERIVFRVEDGEPTPLVQTNDQLGGTYNILQVINASFGPDGRPFVTALMSIEGEPGVFGGALLGRDQGCLVLRALDTVLDEEGEERTVVAPQLALRNEGGDVAFISAIDGTNFGIIASGGQSLPSGETTAFDLTIEEAQRVFRLAPSSEPRKLTVRSSNDLPIAVEWSRLGPGGSNAEIRANERRQTVQCLTIPATDAESYLTVVGHGVGADTTIEVDVLQMPILLDPDGLSTDRAAVGRGAAPTAHMTIRGAGFTASTEFCLIRDETKVAADTVEVIDESFARVVFPIEGALPGVYNVRASDGDREALLEDAFTIAEVELGPTVSAQFKGLDKARYGHWTSWRLCYENKGDSEILAPLFLVSAPPGTEIYVDRVPEYRRRELLVLGTQPEGYPGWLPPGGGGEIRIAFSTTGYVGCEVFPAPECGGCSIALQARLLTEEDAFLRWDRLPVPEGLDPATWDSLWPRLAQRLGPTARDIHRALADAATRLAPRGDQVASVDRLLRFLLREALGQPTSAVIAEVLDYDTGRPVEEGTNVLLYTCPDFDLAGSARTDAFGRVAVSCLMAETEYKVVLSGYETLFDEGEDPDEEPEFLTVTTPKEGDLFGVQIEAFRSFGERTETGGWGDDNPQFRLDLPPEWFTLVHELGQDVVSAWDPNEKDGPDGEEGEGRLLRPDALVEYAVYFENEADATAAAYQVQVCDTLDDDFDLFTFRWGELRIGSDPRQRWSLDQGGADQYTGYLSFSGANNFSTQQNFTIRQQVEEDGEPKELEFEISFNGELDLDTRELKVTLLSLSEDIFDGVLLPNDDLRQGEGSFTFTVMPNSDVEEDDELRNKAQIEFDNLVAIETNTWENRVSFFLPPSMPAFPQPGPQEKGLSPDDPILSWSAEGAESYQFFFWESGTPKPAEPILIDVDAVFAPIELEEGKSYSWQIVAENSNGEVPGPVWTFDTRPAPDCPGPVGPPAPVDGAELQTTPARLDWDDAANSFAYFVYVWRDEGGDPAATRPATPFVGGIANSELPLVAPLAAGAYFWQVTAFSEGGCAVEGPVWRFSVAGGPDPVVTFKRGDVDSSNLFDLTDAIFLLTHLFIGGADPACEKSADFDDSGVLDITDAIQILFFQFIGGVDAMPPFESCGQDPTEDELSCQSFPPCA